MYWFIFMLLFMNVVEQRLVCILWIHVKNIFNSTSVALEKWGSHSATWYSGNNYLLICYLQPVDRNSDLTIKSFTGRDSPKLMKWIPVTIQYDQNQSWIVRNSCEAEYLIIFLSWLKTYHSILRNVHDDIADYLTDDKQGWKYNFLV